MGLQRVKNIAEPVEAWRMVLDGHVPTIRETRWRLHKQRRWIVAAAAAATLMIAAGGFALWQLTSEPKPSAVADDVLAVLAR